MINVLYITGESHSGSTLLTLLLSGHSRVFAPGELKAFSTKHAAKYIAKYHPHLVDTTEHEEINILLKRRCTCGVSPIRQCPFWSEVGHMLHTTFDRRLEGLDVDHKDRVRFVYDNRALFQTLQTISAADWIVDSSKILNRLMRLRDIPEFNIVTLHLVRNPFGVVYSHHRRERPWRTTIHNYFKHEWKRRRALSTFPHVVLTYEELARNPTAAITRCMHAMELHFEPQQLNWPEHQHHLFQGNSMRHDKMGVIKEDARWRSGLSLYQKLYIGGLTLPLRLGAPLHRR